MDWNRALSTVVACLYVGAALFALLSNPSKDAVVILLMTCLLVAAALAMIWHGEGWGGASAGARICNWLSRTARADDEASRRAGRGRQS